MACCLSVGQLTGRGANAPAPPPPAQTVVVHNIVQQPSSAPVQVIYVQQPPQAQGSPQPVQYAEAAPAQPTYVYAHGEVLTNDASAPPVKDPNMV